MNDYEAALRMYARAALKHKRSGEDWLFGAIDFACTAGLIESEVAGQLYREFNLTEEQEERQ